MNFKQFLSMKLAAVNPRFDVNVDDLFTKEVFPPPCTTANFPAIGRMSSEMTDPSSYLQFNPNNQQIVPCCGLEMGINTSDVALRRTIGAPVSFPENFLDSSCLTQFQPSSEWDVDLQNLYNVGFDQGGLSNAFSSQPYTANSLEPNSPIQSSSFKTINQKSIKSKARFNHKNLRSSN